MDLFYNNAGKTGGMETQERKNEKTAASEAEAEQLTAEIEQRESALSAIYARIGQKHYEECDMDAQSEEMQDLFREVEGQKTQIQELHDRVRALRGIRTCKQCGADVLVGDTFCSSCGARIITEITVSSAGGICSCCGHRVEPGQLFCSTCGAKVQVVDDSAVDSLDQDDPVENNFGQDDPVKDNFVKGDPDEEATLIYNPLNAAKKQEQQETTAPENVRRVCPSCGKEVQEGQLYCMFCGAKIEGAGAAKTAPNATEPEPKTVQKICPHCGAVLEPDDVYCTGCGQKVAG